MLAVLSSDVGLISSIIAELKLNSEHTQAVFSIAVHASPKQLILSGEQAPLKEI